MPDVFAVRDGRLYCFEVKTAKGKTTKLQDRKLAELAAAGAIVGVVRSVDDVKRLVNA
jgi:Holliday junction resolvase